MKYELKELETPEDWEVMHRIRQQVLFTQERHPGIVYDRAHPHDTNPLHRKFLLLLDGEPIGTTRLDPRGVFAIVRLVGIVTERQRQGHGSVLERLVAEFAAAGGAHTLWVNAANTALGFYEKRGWHVESWDPEELPDGMASTCTQMVKRIG